MTNLATMPPPTLVAYAGLQKRGAYLRDNTVLYYHNVMYYIITRSGPGLASLASTPLLTLLAESQIYFFLQTGRSSIWKHT